MKKKQNQYNHKIQPISAKQIQFYDYNQSLRNQDSKAISNNSLSLSFSMTQKDSQIKNNFQSDSSRRNSFFKKQNKVVSFPIQSSQLSTMLNQQILMLQSKLDKFEQKFKEQIDKENQGNSKQNIKVSLSKNKKSQQKKTNDISKKKKDNKVGKINSTTRFSVENKSLLNKSQTTDFESKINRRNSILDSKSIGTIKSISRSKDKDIKTLKSEVSKMRTSFQMSQLKRSKLQKNIQNINNRLKKYKILEKKYKYLNEEHQKLRKNFQKSEMIRQKQKKLLLSYKDQIKQLKQQVSKKRV